MWHTFPPPQYSRSEEACMVNIYKTQCVLDRRIYPYPPPHTATPPPLTGAITPPHSGEGGGSAKMSLFHYHYPLIYVN